MQALSCRLCEGFYTQVESPIDNGELAEGCGSLWCCSEAQYAVGWKAIATPLHMRNDPVVGDLVAHIVYRSCRLGILSPCTLSNCQPFPR